MDIGEQIKTERRIQNITQQELCNMIKHRVENVQLLQRELSMIENNKGNPSISKIQAIAQVLGKEWVLS